MSDTTGVGLLMEMSNVTMLRAVATSPAISLELKVRRVSVTDMSRTINMGFNNVYL